MPDDAAGHITGEQPFSEFGGVQGLLGILGTLFGTGGSENSDANSPEGMQAAQQLFAMLMPGLTSDDFSPEAATRDASAAFGGIFRQMAEAGMPVIQGAEGVSGGYNSTSAALLRNDLGARIGEAQANKLTSTKTSYAAAQQGKISQILALIKIISDAHRTQAINRQTQGLANNTDARRAAAAAAAAAALKNALKPQSGKNPQKPGGGGGTKPSGDGPMPRSADRETEEDARQNDPDYGNGDNPSGDPLREYYDDGLSGRQTEEDARQEDPFYGDSSGYYDSEGNLHADNDDPFALMGEIGDQPFDEIGDFPGLDDLGDLGDLGDLWGDGDLGDIPDFDFEDFPDFDFEGDDPFAGGGDPFADPVGDDY